MADPMPTDHRAKLAKIKRFDQLIAYLRDAMGWPITGGDFDELTFEYTPEELGIDTRNAAKIEEIKRLRPLSARQPWGIFFVKFEPKRLPVIALRRILSQVVLKKRATARAAERAAWAADDLLFISNYGEGTPRRISFAHFSQSEASQDLPTLKVLGWDNLDTPLHLDDIADKLTTDLAWPANEHDAETWRKRWRGAFTLRHREVIDTSRDLSIRLAGLARAIRDRIKTALAIETERGPLTKLMKAFQEALVHDLDGDGFADMYAQTIAYGLLSARIADPKSKTADDFAAHMRTNPFLMELMTTFLRVGGRHDKASGPGIDFDELGVSEVVEVLDDANMEAVVRDFGDKNPQEDPVIHFYELFLKAYDPKKRMQRGVFYTPRPIVSYIVRSVHEILQTQFGLADGLADTTTWGGVAKRNAGLAIPVGLKSEDYFVTVLDPAVGTGTFLVEAIEVIHRTLEKKWRDEGHSDTKIVDLWNDYVPDRLLPRLYGYELLMAPYAIAHLKIGLKLYETGYRFGSDERVRIYLTNALEPATDEMKQMVFREWMPALAHEARAVGAIKRDQRFTVVVGNPPYSNVGQLNRIPFILKLLEDYKRGLNERKINLDDDFIKFYRFAHWQLNRMPFGVLGIITNHAFLTGVTHRRMRLCLLADFDYLAIANLHGNVNLKERAPDGTLDENVFDIKTGVAISVLARGSGKKEPAEIRYADLWGSRQSKFDALDRNAVNFSKLVPADYEPELVLFSPRDFSTAREYRMFPSIGDVFGMAGQGIQTKQDYVSIQRTRESLMYVVADFRKLTVRELSKKYDIEPETPSWSIATAKEDLGKGDGEGIEILVRPFDRQWTYFTGRTNGFLARPRRTSTEDFIAGTLGIVVKRQSKEMEFSNVWVVDAAINEGFFSIDPKGRETVFPLYLSPNGLSGGGCNLEAKFITDSPEVTFAYMYGVLYCPTYRSRYSDLLRTEFPRVPMTTDANLLREIASLGADLVAVHLPDESFKLASWNAKKGVSPFAGVKADLEGPGTNVVGPGFPKFTEEKVMINGARWFKGVSNDVWEFHGGGYQLCDKWLKARRGQELSMKEALAYRRMLVAIKTTLRLMERLDEVIQDYGGWEPFVRSSIPRPVPAGG
jgi:hypothetical protein